MVRRRLAGALVTLVTTGALVGTLPGAALAAQGVLTVGGSKYSNPGPGCYQGNLWPLTVINETDTTVLAFDGRNCDGNLLGAVGAGDSAVYELGNSVLVLA
ncbi:hypothetical protein [Embleya sp. NPDC005971]|uniref:hypothetical protein n=1 Tax=Embleya sp. NPDC005971 TaxID=3156724 RepID=UPI0033F80EE5